MDTPLYQSLPTPTSIRLLTIHPGAWSDRLQCGLQVVDLEDAPQYKTLSYAWGPPEPAAKIQLCGKEFKVTPNLAAALHRVRAGPRKSYAYLDRKEDSGQARAWNPEPEVLEENTTKPEVLWIDALCIDQTNIEERSQQVRTMAKIYERGTKVFIWLGEGYPDCDLALNLIVQIRCHYETEGDVDDPFSFLKLRRSIEPRLKL